jgi:hypothetical protein
MMISRRSFVRGTLSAATGKARRGGVTSNLGCESCAMQQLLISAAAGVSAAWIPFQTIEI